MPAESVTTASRQVQIGLVGCGISKSRTPAMHMEEAKAQGFRCDYRLLDMDDDIRAGLSLSAMLDHIEAEGYAGINVTYPYKVQVIPLLDELSHNAQSVGAVNTVIFRDGKRLGHNTDFWGFEQSFKTGFAEVKRDHALLIGAGGAGGAVAHALLDCGVKRLSIHDTEPGRARELADQVRGKWPDIEVNAITSLDDLFTNDHPDGVVNATPMGMAKLPGSALPRTFLTPNLWVADIVYFPLETQLLKDAKAAGCRVLPGSGMAVYQAVRAFELFTGRPADPVRMKAAFGAFDS